MFPPYMPRNSKPVTRWSSVEKVLLKISQNSQENTCARISFLITILTGKNCFAHFSTTMVAWLLLTFLICLHNQLSSIHYITDIKEYRCLKNVIHQIASKNEWLLLSARFTEKFGLTFVLTLENAFS